MWRLTVWLLMATCAFAFGKSFQQGVDKQSSPSIETSEIYSAAKRLNVMLDCPERVWPHYSWSEFRVLYIDPEMSDGVVWNEQPRQISVVSRNRFRTFQANTYQITNNPPGIVFTIGDRFRDINVLVASTVHEGFHATGQSKMQRADWRGEFYPENADARYFRYEMIRALHAALLSQKKTWLRRAAYWLQRFDQSRSEGDAKLELLDVGEGSAEYVGKIAAALSRIGCSAGEPVLLRDAIAHARPLTTNFDKEVESYEIGEFAGLLLDRGGSKTWKSELESGASFLALLLKDAKPKKAKEDRRALTNFRDHFAQENERNGAIVEQLKQQLSSSDFYVLAAPQAFMLGSYSNRYHVAFKLGESVKSLSVNTDATFSLPNGARLNLSSATALIVSLHGVAANGDYMCVTVPKSSVTLGLGWVDVRSSDVSGSGLSVRPITVGDHDNWLVIE